MKHTSTTNSHSSDIPFSAFIKEQFAFSKANLTFEKPLYAKHIVGLEVWEELDNDLKHILGASIIKMVNQNQLALTYVGKNGANWHTYLLK